MTFEKETTIIWTRPNLRFPHPFDTIFFDVDGVMIKTIDSFHATDIAVAEYIAGTINGLDWGQHEHDTGGELPKNDERSDVGSVGARFIAPTGWGGVNATQFATNIEHTGKPLVTLDDINAFKQAGGYNNDWDMCYLLATLFTARLREWKDTPLAQRSIQEWAVLSREANLRGHGGIKWVKDVTPATAQQDYNMIGDLYHEFYWGAAEFSKRFGHAPRYLPGAPGFVHCEKMLFPADLPTRLRDVGIRHLGMITGRVGPEVDSALERMEEYSGERWWEVVISADICPKPDPRALRLAVESVGAAGGMFVGDTADDLDLVLRYRASRKENEPDMLAAMLIHEHEAAIYQERGADFIVESVTEVMGCLPGRIVAND